MYDDGRTPVLGGSGITSGLTFEPVVMDRVTESMETLEVSVGSQAWRGEGMFWSRED